MRYVMLTAIIGLLCGCSSQTKAPDVTDNVKKSLQDANLKDVSVSQDRDKGVVTLTGHVPTQEDKQRAESLAKANAAGQVVANEIGVEPPASASVAREVSKDEDAAIEKNLDAAFRSAGLRNVKHKTKNGVVTLSGTVTAAATKMQAESAAKQVANVQQVVNEIQTAPQRATSTQ